MRNFRKKDLFNKVNIFVIGATLVTIILITRMFQLQIIEHDYYQEIATREQYGFIELPAQRGDIIIKDYHSNEEFDIATNTTLNLLYADPAIIKNPLFLRDKIAPLIFDIEDERATDNERIKKLGKKLAPELSPEEIEKLLKPLTDTELELQFKENLLTRLSEKQRQQIILAQDIKSETLEKIRALALPGTEIIDDDLYAYPSQISNTGFMADTLSPYIEIPAKKLSKILKGENRYV